MWPADAKYYSVPETVSENVATQDSLASKSPSGLSNISGTTARTSHSMHELGHMDSDEMIAHLPDLVAKAERLLDLLAPPQAGEAVVKKLASDLKNSESLTARSLKRAQKAFQDVKELYGQEQLINASIALRGTLGVRDMAEVGDGPWRPDDVFYKANLASLALDTASLLLSPDAMQLSLEKLDRNFPEPFTSRLHGRTGEGSIGSSSLLNETFELALAIRVHFAIQILKEKQADPNFDPDRALIQIFYDQESETVLRSWPVRGLQTSDLNNHKRDAIATIIQTFNLAFDDDNNVVDVKRLQEDFPNYGLFQRLIAWIRLRNDEITDRLAKVGNGERLQVYLDSEMQRRRAVADGKDVPREVRFENGLFAPPEPRATAQQSASVQTQTPPQRSKATPRSSLYNTTTGVEQLRSLDAMLTMGAHPTAQAQESRSKAPSSDAIPPRASSSRQPEAQQPEPGSSDEPQPHDVSGQPETPQEEPGTDGDYQPHDEGTEAEEAPPSARETREIHELHGRLSAAQNKENTRPRSLLERQEGAQRVNFDEPSQLRPNGSSQNPRASSPSEDEGFQIQQNIPQRNRSPRPPRKRKTSPIATDGPEPKRTPLRQLPADVVARRSEARTTEEAQRPTQFSPARTFRIANEQAKLKTFQKSIDQPKPPQQRRPWTDEESAVLQRYIQDKGCSWAKIKALDAENGDIFEGRDQVALKDRARTMYFNYLKCISLSPTPE